MDGREGGQSGKSRAFDFDRRHFRLAQCQITVFMTTLTSTQRPRTCRACGKKFDYPVKGSAATRHHCAART